MGSINKEAQCACLWLLRQHVVVQLYTFAQLLEVKCSIDNVEEGRIMHTHHVDVYPIMLGEFW